MNTKENNKDEMLYKVEILTWNQWNPHTGEGENSDKTYYYNSKEVREYHYWEDALDYFLGAYRRDYWSSHSYAIEKDEDGTEWLTRLEYDEGGDTLYRLNLWKGYEDCIKLLYHVTNNHTQEDFNIDYDGLLKYIKQEKGEDARVCWNTDWHRWILGYPENEDGIDCDIEIENISYSDSSDEYTKKRIAREEYLKEMEKKERRYRKDDYDEEPFDNGELPF